MAAKCPECGKPKSHNAWCSRNTNHPTPKERPKYDEKKRHFKKRPDDGRTPPDKRGR